jgi:SAM-dependent methyltransferase
VTKLIPLKGTSLIFDPHNPLPSVDVESLDYELLKAHAEQMDVWLGYRLEEVEAEVRSAASADTNVGPDREFWIRKPVQTFSTPYLDVLHALREAGTGTDDVVADLGCGYGRVGAVLALQFPGSGFVGIEAVEKREAEAARVLKQFSNLPMKLCCADLRTFDLAEAAVAGRRATIFFIYDFGSREDFEFVFDSLRKFAAQQSVTVIARGGRSRDLIQKTEHWLCSVNPPQHFKRFSIYRS